MKKLLALLLAATLCLFVVACGDKEDEKNNDNANGNQDNNTSVGGMPTGEDPVKDDIDWDL